MARINEHFLKLKAGYLFPEIARRIQRFSDGNPDIQLIKLGIGDVTEPLPDSVIQAMHKAVDELAGRATFRGYGPEQGYGFLREKIAQHDFQSRGCAIDGDEIFVSDGSKCDTANFLDILGPDNKVAVVDPVYPVYVDTNVMAGHTGLANEQGQYEGLVYLPATSENQFTPDLPSQPVQVIYLCYPNNPTGGVATKEVLSRWVQYAHDHEALILFDAAYEAFITDPSIPHSIYEIEDAGDVAIEFRSFSKNAGFTGTRCAYTVVPKSVVGTDRTGQRHHVHSLWNRRQSTKFNGVSYVVQRGAEATYSEAGRKEIAELVAFYLANAKIMRQTLAEIGVDVYGGVNSPYVWFKVPNGQGSWDFFDQLLNQTHIVGTPGVGFGPSGEGYFRLSAFNDRQQVQEAMERIRTQLRL